MAKKGRTWWGEKFLDILVLIMDIGRLKRGRAYSGPNRLLKFSIQNNTVIATVRGNINPYFNVYTEPRYKVSVKLRAIPKKDWERITEDISHNAAFLSQLLMNEMPASIENLFAERNLHLLPYERKDLQSSCSCPDYASPCKHVAGVYYKIASLLDRDPLLLFQLRGMKIQDLNKKLAASPLGQALLDQMAEGDQQIEYHAHRYCDPELEALASKSIKSFWHGEEPLPLVSYSSDAAATPAILIKKGGEYPPFWDRDNSFIEVMEDTYSHIVKKSSALL